MGSRKSGAIEFWRFFFSVGAVMHFGYYNGFYIAVDFFFLLSGFLTAKTVERNPENGVWSITLSKWIRLWPEYILAYALLFAARLFHTPEILPMDRAFVADVVVELLGLQIMSPMSIFINGVTWYVSAMMVCTPLVVWLYQKHRYTFTHIIAPYGALAIYAFFWYNWGHIDFGFVWLGMCNGGLLRGLADLMLGCALYEAFRILSAKEKRPKRGLLTTGFLLLTVVAAYAMMIRESKLDFVCILLMCLAILCIFGGRSSPLLDHKFVYYLGRLSYPIYLNQLFVMTFIGGRSNGTLSQQLRFLVRYLVFLLAVSMLSLWVCEWCTAVVKKKRCPQQ